MTKDKIICKNVYKVIYDKYKINKNINKIIFEDFLFNEYLNEKEMVCALLIDFGHKIRYYIKKICDIDTNVKINPIIDNTNAITLHNSFTIAYFYKNLYYDINRINSLFNHYNVEFYLILDKEPYHIEYKNAFIEYLNLIQEKIKEYYKNKLYEFSIIDVKLEYDFKYEYNDDEFLRLKFYLKYILKKNTLIDNILSNCFNKINKNSVKRNALYENNNKVKEIINCFKFNFIDKLINYF